MLARFPLIEIKFKKKKKGKNQRKNGELKGDCVLKRLQVLHCVSITVSEAVCFLSEFLSGRFRAVRRELIAALRRV